MTGLLDWFFHHCEAEDMARSAPPTGCQYALFLDPLHESEPIAGSAFFAIVSNSDGSSALQVKDGRYLSQEPLQRGVFHLAASIGLYEKFGIMGNIATSWTRPAEGDPIYSYVIARLPNAA